MEEKTEMLACCFCGQTMMCGADEAAEDRCDCYGALEYRRKKENFEKLREALEELCGEEHAQGFQKVENEVVSLLAEMLWRVCFDKIDRATVRLADGTDLTLTKKTVTRKKTVVIQR